MFNIPLPTDSLYKFCFMFGIFLIVFSFYFRDKQLNKYEKAEPYYVLDSLKNNLEHHNKIYNENFLDLNDFQNNARLYDGLNYNWSLQDTFNFRLIEPERSEIIPAYERFLKEHKEHKITSSDIVTFSLHEQLEISKEDNAFTNKLNTDIRQLNEKIKENTIYFDILLCIGFVLFLVGTVCWYFLLQKPQDEILRMQLNQTRLQSTPDKSKILVIGRKHVDPINIKKK